MSFEAIPDEVILGSLLPVLPLGDLMALSATSKRYHYLAVRASCHPLDGM